MQIILCIEVRDTSVMQWCRDADADCRMYREYTESIIPCTWSLTLYFSLYTMYISVHNVHIDSNGHADADAKSG